MSERDPIIAQEVIDRAFRKKGPKQYTLWVDLEYCIGCHACTMGCKAENNTPVGVDYNRVIEVEEGLFDNPKQRPELQVYFVAMPCMHCGKPACMAACPVGAITKRQEDGIVLINKDRCIGCRYCAWACPYGVPTFNAEAKVMEKCTLCVHRVTKGLLPACVETCVAKTRFFGEMNDLVNLIREQRSKRVFLGGASSTVPSVVYTK
ncbi:MAG: 4Fe-4S dicluster domain-containing protein [Desulfarculus sp.]|jgi:tetrathionate reductase subunit B|nr:MAG: 4Fe-4S dicluster domain-containing protein [Desulfarculus sp.]